MENHSSKKAAQSFAASLAASLSEALTGAAGSPWSLKVVDGPDIVKRQGNPVHFRVTVSGALQGECFIEFYEREVADLGAKLLGQPAGEMTPEHTAALEKVIASAMPALAASVASEYGELNFNVDRVSELAFGGMLVVPLAASQPEQADLPVILYFDGQLLSALPSSPAPQTPETERPPIDPVNLKLVMDVELNVSLRFGQRRLPLCEVLELASGSVIELDRQVDEPVELLLDGKLIARGEAVIVDGNYGLRVTEIPHPMVSHFIR